MAKIYAITDGCLYELVIVIYVLVNQWSNFDSKLQSVNQVYAGDVTASTKT